MRGLAAVALVAAARSAAAEEMPVRLYADGHPELAARFELELRALGHEVIVQGAGRDPQAVIRVTAARGVVVARVEAPGAQAVVIELHPADGERLSADVLRAVEALRASQLRVAPVPPRPATPVRPAGVPWHTHLRGGLGGGLVVSPGAAPAIPVLWLRFAWEGALWIEAVGSVAFAGGELGVGGSLRASTVSVGLGAPLVRGAAGALGLTLRGGVAWVEARGEVSTGGAIAVVEAAITGRVRVWRRLAVIASVGLGTTLASVRLREGASDLGEWGRPYLIAAIGLSY